MTISVIPGEISTFTVAIAILSGFILFFGYISMFLKERLFLSEALVAVLVGIIAGPLVTGGFDPNSWAEHDEITKQLTRCIIAIQVMAVGIELPKHYMKKHWTTMFVLLVPVMMIMWLSSGLFIWCFIPRLKFLDALVISACICPTDPILANSVVKGRFAEKHVPPHIRHALSAESGANDGMGFPFLFLAIFLIAENNVGTAIGKWIYITCLFQIALSCIIGVIVGYVARKVLQWSERNHLIDKPSFLAFAIALALFLMSMTGFSGSDDLLACFAAGNAFSWDDWFRSETEEAHFQDVIDMMLNLAIFVYIGAIIPWKDFSNQELGLEPWRLVVIAILVLLFRRLPVVVLLKSTMPEIKTYQEAVFTGWFGPMGVGAVFLSIIAKEELETAYEGKEPPVSIRLIAPVVLFIVFCSVIVHGTTIPLFKLGKRIRTRTLSTSSLTTNQVLRLPKLTGSSNYNEYDNDMETKSMTELERNTRYNTQLYKNRSMVDIHEIRYPTNDSEESDLTDEDFLPDDSSGRPIHPALTRESEQSMDAQHGIRFLEPINPRNRAPSGENASMKSKSPLQREGDTSQRSFLNLFKKKHQAKEQVSEPNHTVVDMSSRAEVRDAVIEDSQQAAPEQIINNKEHGDQKYEIYKNTVKNEVDASLPPNSS